MAQDTFTDYGLLVLSQGAVLNDSAVFRLNQHQIEQVEIDWRNSGMHDEGDEESSPHMELGPLFQDAVSGFKNIYEKAAKDGKVYQEDVEESFQPLLDNIRAERDLVYLLLRLNSEDDYTYQHSVQVGMLSFYIAKWMRWNDERCEQAGLAGLLHDIGKCRIPKAILNKPGKLTDEEYKKIQNHSRYGYEILKNSYDDEMLPQAAHQHHERMNGTGYPLGIKADRIHPISKIVSAADTYSAMISSRVYQKKRDLLFVLKELQRISYDELDPDVVYTFIAHMLPNFIGKRVVLTGDVIGTIVMNHPTDFFHPLVQTGDRFIDLSADGTYEILHIFI